MIKSIELLGIITLAQSAIHSMKRSLSTSHIVSASSPVLMNLGTLEKALVIARPSKTVKSPYVADVVLFKDITDPAKLIDLNAKIAQLAEIPQSPSPSPSKAQAKNDADAQKVRMQSFISSLSPTTYLAHAPSLDCAGMVVPGSTVYLSRASENSSTKTAFAIQLCTELRCTHSEPETANSRSPNPLVGYHPSLSEKLLANLLQTPGFLSEQLDIDDVNIQTSKQVTYGNSRVDFVVENDTHIYLIECKNVVGAEYHTGTVPKARSRVGVYCVDPVNFPDSDSASLPSTSSDFLHAIFPHGTNTKPGLAVVSDRAVKHVHELTMLHGTRDAASNKTFRSIIVFMVSRSDCSAFRPCQEADMMFAQCLQRAVHAGVKVVAQRIGWCIDSDLSLSSPEPKFIKLSHCSQDSPVVTATWEGSVPVVFHRSVDCRALDTDMLKKVLAYNAAGASPTKSSRKSNNGEKKGKKSAHGE